VAHRLISSPASDRGKARIPALKYKRADEEVTASTNDEKGRALAEGFFPPKPQIKTNTGTDKYPKSCSSVGRITREQILTQIRRMKPFQVPGPDGIPNIILSKCADILLERLIHIYDTMLEKNLQYKPWKFFTTIVLHKPGKPNYSAPKAYRPIALLNTMWKILTAIVADQITFLTEKHQLLPPNHFRGRPGCTTTNAMHLAYKIKASWHAGKVAAVLFLDIEGAFPNAVPSILVHNLRKRRIPPKYVNFINNMLCNRKTVLKFDGYTLEPIQINNGIGQGDPLSMILYQYYNADLLEILKHKDEAALAYIDDTLMLTTGDTFKEAHNKLTNMMEHNGSVIDWSTKYNSPLEYTKLALIDFAHKCNNKPRPPLKLQQREVKPSKSTKYLGVIFNQHLK
jgi:hypothetical protein